MAVIDALNGIKLTSIESLDAGRNQLKQGKSLGLQLERCGSLIFLALEPNQGSPPRRATVVPGPKIVRSLAGVEPNIRPRI